MSMPGTQPSLTLIVYTVGISHSHKIHPKEAVSRAVTEKGNKGNVEYGMFISRSVSHWRSCTPRVVVGRLECDYGWSSVARSCQNVLYE